MKKIFCIYFVILISNSFTSCNGQVNTSNETSSDKVGGSCESCELMFTGIPKNILPIDTSLGWAEGGQKLLITGTVYQIDGKTPAPGVIVYYYHTNTEGRYIHDSKKNRSLPPNQLGQTHGYLRGWIKTGADGTYSIYTVRPGTYPTRDEPAHIHLLVKEPGNMSEYYIDEFVFDDDKLLTTAKKRTFENRGGSGILRILNSGDMQIAEHNIILGLNVPNYPVKRNEKIQSGLQIGEDNPSFIPYHAWGPDKGTRTCPVCKYGRYHGIVYFVGNHPNWDDIKKWLTFLEAESTMRSKYLKAYFVYGNEKNYNKQKRQEELEKIGKDLNLKNIALTFVPSMTDEESEVNLNKINGTVENTFVIYKNSKIVDKFINLKPTPGNYERIASTLDKTQGAYFNLLAPQHN